MNSNYDILISFRTPFGFKVCAQYFLGRDLELAETVFTGLSGKDDISDNAVLHLDLVETRDELPVKVKTIGCRLSELCVNCQHITRELFRANAISAGEDHPS